VSCHFHVLLLFIFNECANFVMSFVFTKVVFNLESRERILKIVLLRNLFNKREVRTREKRSR
jgi:hypothetical protein